LLGESSRLRVKLPVGIEAEVGRKGIQRAGERMTDDAG
jgi:hypothetical protein